MRSKIQMGASSGRRIALGFALACAAAASTATPALACRCAPRMLEQYFADAEIVAIGTVTARRPGETPEGTRYIAVDFTPQLSAGRAIKGDLEGVTLVTSDSSASCGVDIVAGETYLLFASRTTPDDHLAWFNSCNGSRLYSRPLGAEHRERVKLSWNRLPALPSQGERSPNGAYRVWTRNPSIRDTPPRSATVIVDVERETLWIELHDVASPVVPTWVNEKLLFVRAWWGRLIGIDVLIDVEAGALVYAEQIDAGTLAFEQHREACAGKCPGAPPADEKR